MAERAGSVFGRFVDRVGGVLPPLQAASASIVQRDSEQQAQVPRPAKRSLARGIVLGVCAIAAVLTYVRLYFGVDLGDEAFHVVVPYRFALGARPFVDEVNFSQEGAGLLALPFIALYHQVVGLDGIILFSRHLYFVFALSVTLAVFLSLRTLLNSTLLALPISLLTLAFIPLNLPSPNYNGLANGFFTAGCFLGLAYTQNRRRKYLLLGGFAHGLAIFAYPTIAIAVAVYGGAFYFLSGRSGRTFAQYIGAVALPCVVWLGVFLSHGVTAARHELDLTRASQSARGVGVDRALSIARDAASAFPLAPLALGAFVAAMLLRHRRQNLSIALLFLMPILAMPARPFDLSHTTASSHLVANLGLLALPLFYAVRTNRLARKLMVGAWIPAFVAAVVISWSTGEGGGHQGVGFLAAAITFAILLAMVVESIAQSTQATRPVFTSPLYVSLVPLIALVALQFGSANHDESPLSLTTRIGSGPYAGLLTTSANANFLDSLTHGLEQTTSPQCGVLFYYDLPAGYLLTDRPPDTNTAFLYDYKSFTGVYDPALLDYYAENGGLPDVAVRVTRIPAYVGTGRPHYARNDQLDKVFEGPAYKLAKRTGSYAIYTRRRQPCPDRYSRSSGGR
jgi:hypothetical protein